MLNELEEMICFAAVCDTGTMTGAAKILHRSKAHVSRKISDFELRIKTKLLHRTTRKITVTDAGERLKDEALQLYQNSKYLSHQASSLNNNLSGKFRIAAPMSIFWCVLSPIMNELQTKFPYVDFELISDNESVDLISDGIDIAIRTGNIEDDRLIAHQVGVGRDVFFVGKGKYNVEEKFRKITDVMDERLVLITRSIDNGKLRLINEEQNLELRIQKATVSNEYPLAINLVRNGCGIGFAPKYSIVELVKSGELTPIFPTWHGKKWPIYIAYPFITPIPDKLQKISRFLRNKLEKKIGF